MSEDQILEGITKELSLEFGKYKDKIKEDLKMWVSILFKLRLAKLKGSKEQIVELEKSERYAYAAITALKAQYGEQIKKDAWEFTEKVMVLLKKVILT